MDVKCSIQCFSKAKKTKYMPCYILSMIFHFSSTPYSMKVFCLNEKWVATGYWAYQYGLWMGYYWIIQIIPDKNVEKKKRYKLEANDILDWRNDPEERARMIWEWWRVRLLSDTNIFPAFRKCLRLVVLSQTSSCTVERVFFRLNMIRNTCGESTYEDMTEIRVLMQCNGDLGEFAQNF